MFLKIIKRDLILNSSIIFINLAIMSVFFLFYLYRIEIPVIARGITCIWLVITPLSMVAREDKFKSMAILCSLPVNRSMVIVARYVFSWLVVLGGMGYVLGLSALLSLSPLSVKGIFNVLSIGRDVLVSVLVISIMFPFVLRFGQSGFMSLVLGLNFLTVLLLIITIISRTSIGAVIDWVIVKAGAFKEAIGSPAGFLVFFLCVLGINGLSLLIASRLFRKRDL